MNLSQQVEPDPTLEKRTLRRFGGTEKQRLLAEFESLGHGEKGAWLRRKGLYAAQLSGWRRWAREHGSSALEPKPTGRKPADPRDRQIEALQRENSKLTKRVRLSEALVDLQKKVLAQIEQDEAGTTS